MPGEIILRDRSGNRIGMLSRGADGRVVCRDFGTGLRCD